MNVLLFVTTLMMLLAAMTYAKIESYRSLSALKAQYQTYMEHIEREHMRKKALVLYDKTHLSSKSKAEKDKVQATPRINWLTVINLEVRNQNTELHEQVLTWSKNLITQLYGDQPFFQEALAKKYHLLDDLFKEIDTAITALPVDKRPAKASDLANLKLESHELNEFLYKILKGNLITEPKIEKKSVKRKTITQRLDESELEENDAIEDLVNLDFNESSADEGYVSLLDFITIKGQSKIRLFLAPREVLLAIFEDGHRVDEIMQERYALYRRVDRKTLEKQEASELFKDFMTQRLNNLDIELFDFSVTKVDPNRYGNKKLKTIFE